MHARGDAGRHQERRYASEHANLVARDATAFHQAPMGTRKHAHVMQNSRHMETSLSALNHINMPT